MKNTNRMEKSSLRSAYGGIMISFLYQEPATAPRGIVQLVHGMCEHKERYIPLMEFLCGKGYAVVCHDHRGHGESVQSPKDLGYMGKKGWLALVEDAKLVTDWAKEKWPGLPLTLFGHSMGSLVVRSYAKRYDDAIDSLIVCGCPSDNPAKGAGIFLARATGLLRGWHYRPALMQKMSFGNYNKPFEKEGWAAGWVCSDRDVLEAYHADPLCQYVFTADGFLNLLLLMKDCYCLKGWKMARPDLPVRFISGGEDPCRVSDDALRKAVESMKQAGYKDVTLRIYPGMRHEIQNETRRQIVWDDILGFLA